MIKLRLSASRYLIIVGTKLSVSQFFFYKIQNDPHLTTEIVVLNMSLFITRLVLTIVRLIPLLYERAITVFVFVFALHYTNLVR